MNKLGGSLFVLSSLFTILAAASGGVGCEASASGSGSGTGDGDGGAGTFSLPPPGLSKDDAQKVCTALRTPECNRLQKCSPMMMQVIWGDVATCLQRNILECTLALTLRGVTVTQAQADACAAQIDAKACDSRQDVLSACVIPGVVADNGPCISDDQCKSANCEGGSLSTCGKCTPRPKDGTAAIGAACTASKDCETWASCKNGKCAEAGRAKGQPCTDDDNCIATLGLYCEEGLGCSTVTAVAETTQACPPDHANFAGTLCHDGVCDPNVKPTVCHARGGEGGACGTSEDICASPYGCDQASKKCVIPTLDYEGVCKLNK